MRMKMWSRILECRLLVAGNAVLIGKNRKIPKRRRKKNSRNTNRRRRRRRRMENTTRLKRAIGE